jgi:ribonucleoside-diphosphate reductase alpha chain
MQVIKRNGSHVNVRFDEITDRISSMCNELTTLDPAKISQEVGSRVIDGITTSELDQLTGKLCASKITIHPEYGVLASRLVIDDHQKNSDRNFSDVCRNLYYNKDQLEEHCPLINNEVFEISKNYNKELSEIIDHNRDYLIDYFGFKTLERSYLLKIDDKCVETPQHMWMRVSLGIHGNNIIKVKETYDLMSKKYFTHATPTLFNAGTINQQFASCFLLGTDDSVDGIFKTITDCAKISKWSGGIGVHISNVRGKGSYIRKTAGYSDGIVPMLKTYNATARYINQGGKRSGSFAMYIEPWHKDILDFLECKKNHGAMEQRALDLFYALWIPDLFMKRVKDGGNWSLMCPSECPGLHDVYGDEFEELYCKYENDPKYKKTVVEARVVWEHIINSQIETGTPYMCYKDSINKKNNQSNIGIIKSSNLCSEIMEYSDSKEHAVCNLASIALPQFVEFDENDVPSFNHDKLIKVARVITYNLNQIIDRNFYPTPETKLSNLKHRPIGVGVQGLADTYNRMRMPFDSDEAAELNKLIFETIYYGCVTESIDIAKIDGPYSTFEGSPFSKGILQFDMWVDDFKGNYDWDSVRSDIKKYGIRNSLLTALMPTASTSQILGFNECFEPRTSNIYVRRTLAGEFQVVNNYMVNDLIKLGLWDNVMRNEIIMNKGSIQNIKNIPDNIKNLYKTVWEIKQKVLIDQSADRALFVDQSQSLNLFFDVPKYQLLTKAHFYGWEKGLKTGSYYIRSNSSVDAKSTIRHENKDTDPNVVGDENECLNCSS